MASGPSAHKRGVEDEPADAAETEIVPSLEPDRVALRGAMVPPPTRTTDEDAPDSVAQAPTDQASVRSVPPLSRVTTPDPEYGLKTSGYASYDSKPSYVPTVLITLLFGIFGLIPAVRHSRMAAERGYDQSGYWWAFGTIMVVGVAVTILLPLAIVYEITHANVNNGPSSPIASSETGNTGTASSPNQQPETTSATTLPSGLVSVDTSAVNSNSQASAAATTFETYFGGIDNQNYQQAYSAYSPTYQSNVSESSFASSDATSDDTDIQITSLTTNASGSVTADVSFTSQQSASDAPVPGETCTQWTLAYTLVPASGGSLAYLIDSASSIGPGHVGCPGQS